MELINYESLFERSNNPYMVVNAELRIVAANEAYLRITGNTRASIIGRELVPGEELRASLERVIASGERDQVRYTVAELRVWSATQTPLLNAEGRVIFVLHHPVDVTELSSLRETNSNLERFVYVASHDLKAPLRGIATTAKFIEEEIGRTTSPEAREYLRLLRGRVTRMDALIEGILSHARGGEDDVKQTVNVEELARETFELLAPGPNVRFRLAPGLPTLTTSKAPLQQVFLNLFSNALTHSKRCDVSITVSCEREGELYRFCVGDNGPGIAPEFHERVWEMFQTLQPRDAGEGSGIGLATVKKIVESRGGKVAIESTPGTGARLLFWWPAHER